MTGARTSSRGSHSPVAVRWAELAVATGLDDLPADTIDRARAVTLDFLGVLAAGADEPVARLVADHYAAAGGASEAIAVGCPAKLPAANAATVNGVAAHALDMDDGNRAAAGHPGAAVLPAALAAAELSGCSGSELVRAIVLGYEAFGRLGEALNPGHLQRGFHTSATAGSVAAAMAAGVALGNDVDQLAAAIGLGALQGAGLLEVVADGAAAKPLQVGRASGAGVLAAQLARRGLRGPARALEGASGMLAAMGDGAVADLLVAELGERWEIDRTYFKLHASCRHTHPAIDAVLALRGEGLSADAVESVAVGTHAVGLRLCGGPPDPAGPPEARFSIPFTVALALCEGDASAAAFTADNVADAGLRELAGRVEVALDSELDALFPGRRGARVEVTLRDGGTLTREVLVPHGEPEDPATAAELAAKFDANAARLSADARAELRGALGLLEWLPDCGALLAPLAPAAVASALSAR